MDAIEFMPLAIVSVLFFVLTIVTRNIVNIDPAAQSYFTYAYTTLLFTIISVGLYTIQRYSKQVRDYVILFVGLSFIGLIVAAEFFMNLRNIFSYNFFDYVLQFSIVLGIGMLIYNVFKNSYSQNFLFQLILYLPCLLTDFIHYLGGEYATTPTIVFTVFICEVLFIIAYIGLPKLVTKVSTAGMIPLLEGSAFLDIQQTLSNSEPFQVGPPAKGNFADLAPVNFNTEYSMTMWTYSSSSRNTNETEIFCYGLAGQEGKPRLTYQNNVDNTKKLQNKYIVYFTNNSHVDPATETTAYVTLPDQRWNYLVFNYNSNGMCDLFVNGQLEKTVSLGKNQPNYSTADAVSIGTDSTNGNGGGMYGAISNVCYYKRVLSSYEIANIYNLLKTMNPPTFNS
jgi:hypothetical protein